MGTATHYYRVHGERWPFDLFALAGVLGVVFLGVTIADDAGNPAVFGVIDHGGAERMIVSPAMSWLVAFGGCLLGRTDPAPVS